MNEVTAIRSGNEKVFTGLYHRYHPKLYSYFYKKTQSPYLSEELVQLAFIKLWNSRHTLKEELPLDLQLFRVAKTALIDLLRKEAAARRRTEMLSSEQDENPSYYPHTAMDAAETLQTAMNNLPPVRRKILLLSREQGLSHREIADSLRITPKAVENQLARALKQLKHFFSFFM